MALLAILAIPLHAQRLVIGERVPDLNITQWLNGAPVSDGKAVMVEFYHSSNPKGAERLAQLDELAKSYGDRLAVIVVTREKDDAVISSLLGGNPPTAWAMTAMVRSSRLSRPVMSPTRSFTTNGDASFG